MICWTCLESGREVVDVGQYREMYCHIMRFQNLQLVQDSNWLQAMRVCWECAALLRRVTEFHVKAVKASETLYTAKNTGMVIKQEPVAQEQGPTPLPPDVQFLDPDELLIELKVEVKESEDILDVSYMNKQESGSLDVKPLKLPKEHNDEDSLKAKEKVKNIEKPAKPKPTQGAKIEFKLIENTTNSEEFIEDKHIIEFKASREGVMEYRKNKSKKDNYALKSYKCEYCIVSFDTDENYKKHLSTKNHGGLFGLYSCEVCELKFEDEETKDGHVTKHYQWYKCTLCGMSNPRKGAFRDHEKKHKTIQVLRQCLKCDIIFETQSELRKHYEIHSVYRCDFCLRQYLKRTAFEKHLRLSHGFEKPHKCKECHREFNTKSKLQGHYDYTHRPAPPELRHCVVCNRTFDTVRKYQAHMKSKHSDKPKVDVSRKKCSCPHCGKILHRLRSLQRHIKTVHLGIKEPNDNICPYCKKGFTRANILKHLRTHTGEKPYQCSNCGMKFGQRSALVEHAIRKHNNDIRMHSKYTPDGDEPSGEPKKLPPMERLCTHCNKVFKSAQCYRVHLNRLQGTHKWYHCTQCVKRFSSNYLLKEHIGVVHDKTLQFICKEHNKEFSSKVGLMTHYKCVHQLEREFICHYCAHGFPIKANLIRHLRIHTGEKPYKCPHCTSTFNTRDAFRGHVQHIHLKIPRPPRAPRRKKQEP